MDEEVPDRAGLLSGDPCLQVGVGTVGGQDSLPLIGIIEHRKRQALRHRYPTDRLVGKGLQQDVLSEILWAVGGGLLDLLVIHQIGEDPVDLKPVSFGLVQPEPLVERVDDLRQRGLVQPFAYSQSAMCASNPASSTVVSLRPTVQNRAPMCAATPTSNLREG